MKIGAILKLCKKNKEKLSVSQENVMVVFLRWTALPFIFTIIYFCTVLEIVFCTYRSGQLDFVVPTEILHLYFGMDTTDFGLLSRVSGL